MINPIPKRVHLTRSFGTKEAAAWAPSPLGSVNLAGRKSHYSTGEKAISAVADALGRRTSADIKYAGRRFRFYRVSPPPTLCASKYPTPEKWSPRRRRAFAGRDESGFKAGVFSLSRLDILDFVFTILLVRLQLVFTY